MKTGTLSGNCETCDLFTDRLTIDSRGEWVCQGCISNPITVTIDGLLTVECSYLLNGGERWNGWVQPVFTQEQLAPIAEWFATLTDEERDGFTFAESVSDLGNGKFVFYGWTWELGSEGVK